MASSLRKGTVWESRNTKDGETGELKYIKKDVGQHKEGRKGMKRG
jgi:hypothetical protein